MNPVQSVARLRAEQVTGVLELAERVRLADRVDPLNEAARLSLAGHGGPTTHWLLHADDTLIGYAQLDERDGSVQLFVDPASRGQGWGRRLSDAVRADGRVRSWWAFGDLAPARALAAALGLRVIRGLYKMTLAEIPAIEPTVPPVRIDHFRPTDLDDLVAVNAAAFATHPEQGALRAADFRARMAAPGYRDTDLLVARDTDQRLVGFHWTKLEPPAGEVYVIGVTPAHSGKGIGRALLEAGIIHMRQQGAQRIDLYVEAANDRVVSMYREAGFEVTHTDVAYGWPVKEDQWRN